MCKHIILQSYGDCEPMKANASALMIRMLDEPFNPVTRNYLTKYKQRTIILL